MSSIQSGSLRVLATTSAALLSPFTSEALTLPPPDRRLIPSAWRAAADSQFNSRQGAVVGEEDPFKLETVARSDFMTLGFSPTSVTYAFRCLTFSGDAEKEVSLSRYSKNQSWIVKINSRLDGVVSCLSVQPPAGEKLDTLITEVKKFERGCPDRMSYEKLVQLLYSFVDERSGKLAHAQMWPGIKAGAQPFSLINEAYKIFKNYDDVNLNLGEIRDAVTGLDLSARGYVVMPVTTNNPQSASERHAYVPFQMLLGFRESELRASFSNKKGECLQEGKFQITSREGLEITLDRLTRLLSLTQII